MSRHSTHHLGVACAQCREQLVPDDCCVPGHGSTLQESTPWAARTWPGHECFAQHAAPVDVTSEAEMRSWLTREMAVALAHEENHPEALWSTGVPGECGHPTCEAKRDGAPS